MILAALIVGTTIMTPFGVWHYYGYWNGRYDPLTPCPDTEYDPETTETRKDHDS